MVNICKYSVHECSRAGKDGKCKDKEMVKYGCYKYDGKVELSEDVKT